MVNKPTIVPRIILLNRWFFDNDSEYNLISVDLKV